MNATEFWRILKQFVEVGFVLNQYFLMLFDEMLRMIMIFSCCECGNVDMIMINMCSQGQNWLS